MSAFENFNTSMQDQLIAQNVSGMIDNPYLAQLLTIGLQGGGNYLSKYLQQKKINTPTKQSTQISNIPSISSFNPSLSNNFTPQLTTPSINPPTSTIPMWKLKAQINSNTNLNPNLNTSSTSGSIIGKNLSEIPKDFGSEVNSTSKTGGTQLKGQVGGLVGGLAGGQVGNMVGNAIFGDSQSGQMATGVLSTLGSSVGSTVASQLAAGQAINLSSLGSAASLGSGAAALGNIALDVFDPVKKSKWEQGVGAGLGLASLIPGVGLGAAAAGLVFNTAGHLSAKKTRSFKADQELLSQTGNSYIGSTSKIMKAQSQAGQKYSGFNNGDRKKTNAFINEADREQNIIDGIIDYNNDRREIRNSMASINGSKRQYDLLGGYDQSATRIGKRGLKISPKEAKRISSIPKKKEGGTIIELIPSFTEIELVNPNDVPEFQEGGSINVIPEGALHARKHNMDMEGITKKGIPVVADDNGEIKQQAEIEKEEIIFRLEVTKKLEELQKKYYNEETSQKEKDECALEAGKLLAQEIIHNTVDNTNNIL